MEPRNFKKGEFGRQTDIHQLTLVTMSYIMTRLLLKGIFPASAVHFVHITSVSKLKITRNCYFLNAFHPDLEGIKALNYFFSLANPIYRTIFVKIYCYNTLL